MIQAASKLHPFIIILILKFIFLCFVLFDINEIYDSESNQNYQFQYSNTNARVAKNSQYGLNLYLDNTYEIRDGRSSKYYFAGTPFVSRFFLNHNNSFLLILSFRSESGW